MIKTVFEVGTPVVPSYHAHGGIIDDSFAEVYSEWIELEHVKYLYAHGEIVESEFTDLTHRMGKRYAVSWSLPEEYAVWFILKWGTVPGVET